MHGIEVAAKLIFEANHSDEALDLLRQFIAERYTPEAQEKIIAEQAREIRILEDKVNCLKIHVAADNFLQVGVSFALRTAAVR
jgi:hypothetical protein